jgi:parallel beta-helix repeat protein
VDHDSCYAKLVPKADGFMSLFDAIDYWIVDDEWCYALDDITINNGLTLTVPLNFTVGFDDNCRLIVSGILDAQGTSSDPIVFTRSGTSGTWGGIKFQNGSSGSLEYCDISYANYGVYCNNADPDIENNTFENNTYGIYLYNADPDVISNYVSGDKVYLNNSDAYFENNYFCNSSSDMYSMYLYSSSPALFENSIIGSPTLTAVIASNGSCPQFGEDVIEGYGYNELSITEGDFTIWAQYSSEPFLGYNDADVPYGGYNSITGGDVTGLAAATSNSFISADFCWWGSYPPPQGLIGDYVSYEQPLTSDPGGGSSLGKTVPGSPEYVSNDDSESNPKSAAARSLFQYGLQLLHEARYSEAVSVFGAIIEGYSDTPYAYRALNRLFFVKKYDRQFNVTAVLQELLDRVDDTELRATIQDRLVGLYLREGELEQAVELSKAIWREYPDTEHEYTALFNLFNLYQKDLGDNLAAAKVLAELERKYPESELTIVACCDHGEDVD